MHFPRPNLATAMLAAAFSDGGMLHSRISRTSEHRDLSELGQRRARQYVHSLGLTRLRKIDSRRRPLRIKGAGKVVSRIQKR